MQDLGTLQLSQKMTGVTLVAEDTKGNIVPNFGSPSFTVSPVGLVSFANLATSTALPAGSTFTVDILAEAVGQATVTVQGQQGNFLPTFTTQFTVEVVPNPNTPGPPTQWVLTPGTIVSQ
jgi:hypothetical protein